MKVLHIVDGLHPKRGGVPTAVLNICTLFNKMGVSYDILSVGENPEELPERTIGFSEKKIWKFNYTSNGLNWLRENYVNYDIFYFHSVWNTSLLKMYRFILNKGKDYCISPHGSLDPFDVKKKYYLKKVLGFFLINKILTRAKYIFCTSQIETDVICYFGEKASNARVLPLPVDYEDWKLGSRERFRTKYNIKEDDFVFLFLSRINYKKGLDDFINSLSVLTSNKKINSSKIRLVIAGDDNNEYATKMKSLVEKNGLGQLVTFTGLLTSSFKADAYVGADLFILPSKNENFGLAIVEALQSGTPVLISKNVYIYKELFERKNIYPGWLCNENLTDLGDCIMNTQNNYSREKLSADSFTAGRQYCSEELAKLYSVYFN